MEIMDLHYTYEIEVTNYCNARCVFCANHAQKRTQGYISVEKFKRFIYNQSNRLNDNAFRKSGIFTFPRVTFCGLGEPLLHPQICELVSIASRNGFFTQLVTNGALLTVDLLNQLIECGLNELDISLHSVNKVNYNAITGLNLDDVLYSIKSCSEILSKSRIKVGFWRIKHMASIFQDSIEDNNLYYAFITSLGLSADTVLGPSYAWSRDGFVGQSECHIVNDSPFWCNKIAFVMNVDWQGNVVLCCNDYNSEKNCFGNAFGELFDYNLYSLRKIELLKKHDVPNMCTTCKRWRDTEFYEILDSHNIDKDVFIDSFISPLLGLHHYDV